MTARDATDCDEYRALLRGVLLEPESDLKRLVLADWLEERGDGERAEFIRVQCGVAAADPKSGPDYDRLYSRMEALWYAPARGFDDHDFWLDWTLTVGAFVEQSWRPAARVARGFAGTIRCTEDSFRRNAPHLFARHPITRVEILGEVRNATRLTPQGMTVTSSDPQWQGRWAAEWLVPTDSFPAMKDTFADLDDLVSRLLADCGRSAAGLPPLFPRVTGTLNIFDPNTARPARLRAVPPVVLGRSDATPRIRTNDGAVYWGWYEATSTRHAAGDGFLPAAIFARLPGPLLPRRAGDDFRLKYYATRAEALDDLASVTPPQ